MIFVIGFVVSFHSLPFPGPLRCALSQSQVLAQQEQEIWRLQAEAETRKAETEADRAALVQLHASAGGAQWKQDDGWKSVSFVHKMHGVGVGGTHGGRVSTLDLRNNDLVSSQSTRSMPRAARSVLCVCLYMC